MDAKSVDPRECRVAFLYDYFGRRINQTLHEGTVASWRYGSSGVTLAQDRSGRRTELAYDGFGRMISKKDPKGDTFQYAYNIAAI